MCPGTLGIALRTRRFFLWPAFPRVGRVTSDLVRGMSVTDFTTRYPHSKIGLTMGKVAISTLAFGALKS